MERGQRVGKGEDTKERDERGERREEEGLGREEKKEDRGK